MLVGGEPGPTQDVVVFSLLAEEETPECMKNLSKFPYYYREAASASFNQGTL